MGGIPSSCADGEMGEIEIAYVVGYNLTAVWHVDGNWICGNLSIDMWCVNRYVVGGATGICNGLSIFML